MTSPTSPATRLAFSPPTLEWKGEVPGELCLLDQTLLPGQTKVIPCRSVDRVFDAIRRLAVRGAPAIGVAAAYGVVIGVQDALDDSRAFERKLGRTADQLKEARPTAVNLFWAIDRMLQAAERTSGRPPRDRAAGLLAEARAIHLEDEQRCHAIGVHGSRFISPGFRVLTHCNAGALATGGIGTALAIFYTAAEQGKRFEVFADETRPLFQGARLTAWELSRARIPVTVICDSVVGSLMRRGRLDAVFVGADRIAANGDVANKIGTYTVSVLAKEHGVPFYVAAPSSTFDLSIASGEDIPIEERSREEVAGPKDDLRIPDGVPVYNPAFDVTPARNITALITEKGVIEHPEGDKVRRVIERS